MAKRKTPPPPSLPSAALYLRVSTGRQAESDLSIPDQRRQLQDYCKGKAWPMAEEFVEPGNTATDDRRPAFQRMIDTAMAKPPPFHVILVHSFSRFFRDQFLFEFYARKLAKNGVRIVSITQEVGDDPMGVMVRQMMNLFDEYQSRENAKHTLRAMKENARQGFWNGSHPPMGYRVVAAEQRGEKIKKKLEIDPIGAETVRKIYRLALFGVGGSGPMGIKSIATYLNDHNITTRAGGRWGVGTVHHTLTRTTYIGEHVFNSRNWASQELKDETERVVMQVPPLVDRDTFEAVQNAMALRNPRTMAPRFVTSPILLGGICFCSLCGNAMTLRTGKGGAYRYYTCCTKARQGASGCEGMSVRMDLLDASVIDHLENRLLNPERLATMMDNILDRRSEWIDRRRRHVADLRKMSTEADQRLGRLYLSIEQGIIDPTDPSLKQRIAELKSQRDAAEGDAKRAAAAVEKITPTLTPDLLRRFSEATREMFRDDNGAYRRDLIRAVAQKVEMLSPFEAKICGSKVELLRTLASNNGVESTALAVPPLVRRWHPMSDKTKNSADAGAQVHGSEPGWRALLDSNQRPLA
ncbi:recombinase family protein [Caulobacter sp. RHG1]|uniref:recombinase family protein n=1 Tax=Caulobacter sp. (strain RHG1) TaxID=2545762 RepID=UPI001552BF9B|nr:recombinase family protein [Caulobacter sp. RHG1]